MLFFLRYSTFLSIYLSLTLIKCLDNYKYRYTIKNIGRLKINVEEGCRSAIQ